MVIAAWYRGPLGPTPREHVLSARPRPEGLTALSMILETSSKMKEETLPAVRRLDAPSPEHLHQLAQVLVDCVEGGASVSFMLPLGLDRALAFWQGVAQGVAGVTGCCWWLRTRAASAAPCNW